MSVSFVAGQLPPVFFICLIISSLWLHSYLHLNIKWSTVCSSSSQGHIRLSVSPSLYKYDFMLPCHVSKTDNYGNTGIFCVSLFFTDGNVCVVCVCGVCVCECVCPCGVCMCVCVCEFVCVRVVCVYVCVCGTMDVWLMFHRFSDLLLLFIDVC